MDAILARAAAAAAAARVAGGGGARAGCVSSSRRRQLGEQLLFQNGASQRVQLFAIVRCKY